MSDSKKPKLSELRARVKNIGSVEWTNSYWDCDRCGEKRIFGSHHCPKITFSLESAKTDVPYLLDLAERMGKSIQAYVDQCRTWNCDNDCKCDLCKEARELLQELKQ